jgi:hypothetical protein
MMAEELAVSIRLANPKIKPAGSSRGNPPIIMDCFPPLGDEEGYTSCPIPSS